MCQNPNMCGKKHPGVDIPMYLFFPKGLGKSQTSAKMQFYAQVWLFLNIFAKIKTCEEKTIMLPNTFFLRGNKNFVIRSFSTILFNLLSLSSNASFVENEQFHL